MNRNLVQEGGRLGKKSSILGILGDFKIIGEKRKVGEKVNGL